VADQINGPASDPFARSWHTLVRARRPAPERNDKSLLAVLDRIAATEGCTRRGNRPFPHPFPARMPIDVAITAIEGLTEPRDIVLDPMSGSGVVPHAAQRLNRVGIGRDIDPLAILLGRALCLPTAPHKLLAAGEHVLDRARSIVRGPEFLENCLKRRTEEEQKFIGYWFKERAAAEMFALTVALEELAPGPVMLALYVALSSLVISRGSGASMAMDLSRSRPHRVLTKIPRLPFDGWMKRVGEFVRHCENRGSMVDEADVRLGDARDLTLPDESVDAVITSPPYVNAIDYFRASKFSLVFFGFDLATLRGIRSTSIGTEVGLQRGQLSAVLETLVERRVMDRQRRPMLRRYVYDLLETLRETYRVLRPGGRALYVMGPSILSRREYDGAEVLGQIAAFVGYRVVGCSRRDLSPTNRSLPPPRRVARAQTINRRMTCELYALLLKEDG
jgi:DNA modification methylase